MNTQNEDERTNEVEGKPESFNPEIEDEFRDMIVKSSNIQHEESFFLHLEKGYNFKGERGRRLASFPMIMIGRKKNNHQP